MKMIKYELRRFLLVAVITLGFISSLMFLSIFYETSLEYEIDQIVLIVALLGFFVSSSLIFIKQYHTQQILYYHSDKPGYMKTYSFTLIMSMFMLGILIYGILLINIKALFAYSSDAYIFLENGIDQYVFVFITKYAYEILMMIFVYVFNIVYLTLVVSYGISLIFYKIKYERLYTNKRTVIISIMWLITIHIFYRLFVFILYRPLGFLNFNHFEYYDLITFGDKFLFINPLFLPAFAIYIFEFYRMYKSITEVSTKNDAL